ncbi:hypothetical protein SADUNF_Sadunf04G0022500 [Salix dunnii]|uniref:Uncharacterized protein n=1 Tax=Salix dunnii TaxID=1413687 RepID=A0A835K3G4_9ROSI|nr:hypothetical protein SADUNF_Sadunf04G0022500 [Salix dunnii]
MPSWAREKKKDSEMAGGRLPLIIKGGKVSRGFASRLIPKRGQVKVAIVAGLAHSFSSVFSRRASRRASSHI